MDNNLKKKSKILIIKNIICKFFAYFFAVINRKLLFVDKYSIINKEPALIKSRFFN